MVCLTLALAGSSMVAVAHEKIVAVLANSVGVIEMKVGSGEMRARGKVLLRPLHSSRRRQPPSPG
jgi:hypothetical protein